MGADSKLTGNVTFRAKVTTITQDSDGIWSATFTSLGDGHYQEAMVTGKDLGYLKKGSSVVVSVVSV
jgi:hypothetical protein